MTCHSAEWPGDLATIDSSRFHIGNYSWQDTSQRYSFQHGDRNEDLRDLFSKYKWIPVLIAYACYHPCTKSWAVTVTSNGATQTHITDSPSSVCPAISTVGFPPTKFSPINHLYKYHHQSRLTETQPILDCVREEKSSFAKSSPPSSWWQSLARLADNKGLNVPFESTFFLVPIHSVFQLDHPKACAPFLLQLSMKKTNSP